MTQPSLSYQIARLEEDLGEALFLRKPRQVELSDSGMLLLDSAARIVEEQEKALARFRMRETLQEGELRFGIIPTMAPYLLPPLLGAFREAYPAIKVVARESHTAELLREVVDGDLEFSIVSDLEAGLLKRYSLHLTALFKERLLLAAPSVHPICAKKWVKPSSLDERELILLGEGNCLREQTVKLCNRKDHASALACEQLPTLLSMVAAGLGMAVVPEMAVEKAVPTGVTLLRFEEPGPTRAIGMLKRRGSKLGIAAREFVSRLQESLLEN